MAQPFGDRVDGCSLVEQPCAVRNPQIMQPDREAENFCGSFCELLGDAVGMPRRVERTSGGREHQPFAWQPHKAEIYIGRIWRAGHDAEIFSPLVR